MSLRLASLFQDHAVLQRDQLLPVWGWAQPGQSITIQLGDISRKTQANTVGHFLCNFPPFPAGGPHTLTVTVQETGESIVVRDILIGEVWLASGQSNMEFNLQQCEPRMTEDIESADFPKIRCFCVERQLYVGVQPLCPGQWKLTTPDNARLFSAVAFTFARRLHQELNVPVGIITSSYGGTRVEAWTSKLGLRQIPALTHWLNDYHVDVYSGMVDERRKELEKQKSAKFPRDPGNEGVRQGWHQPDFAYQEWPLMDIPALWQYHGLMFSGIFWFRKRVTLPASWKGKSITLNIGSIDKQDVSYANGVEIGRMGKGVELDHWDKPRRYTIPASLTEGGVVDLAIRVFSFMAGGGITGANKEFFLELTDGETLPLAGKWHYAIEHNFGVVDHEIPAIMGAGEQNSAHMLFDNMIAPLVPYGIRGAIWYQGESNAANTGQYLEMMKRLILDWRYQWGQGDFPFIITQLTGYQKVEDHIEDCSWAAIREAQLQTAEQLPNVGLAVTTDVGESNDIHPKNKGPIGFRLAQYALHHTYERKELIPGSPLLKECSVESNTIRCRFYNANNGLISANQQPLRTFVIAGEDRNFVTAEARIDGDSVIVSHPSIATPRHLRYGWSFNPQEANLSNAEGFPASPFRFDAV